ncbi:MAG: hypothetical protein SNF33_04440 [Candidatus Algichlamydia australiensis]|nr:hypothetical protein [Chlamydiales bacterium]
MFNLVKAHQDPRHESNGLLPLFGKLEDAAILIGTFALPVMLYRGGFFQNYSLQNATKTRVFVLTYGVALALRLLATTVGRAVRRSSKNTETPQQSEKVSLPKPPVEKQPEQKETTSWWVKRLLSEAEEKDREIEVLKGQLRTVDDEKRKLQRANRELPREKAKVEELEKELEREKKIHAEVGSDFVNKLASLRTQLKEKGQEHLESQIIELQEKNEQLESKVEELRSENMQLRSANINLQTSHNDEKNKMAREIIFLKGKISAQEIDIASLKGRDALQKKWSAVSRGPGIKEASKEKIEEVE